jgi:hypothetical protein
MGNYKQAMEQWSLAEMEGDAGYVTEIRNAFEKSGYPGFLRVDAKHSESKNDYLRAAGDYAMLGDKDGAFAALERAFANRVGVLFIKVEPVLDNLRSDPRFATLLQRKELPQ